jgi:phage repressor protein C with HTH and peptisase S24 domain
MGGPKFEEFGERLTNVRKSMGYSSRKSLAHELRIHPETLGGYERGETKPDFEFLADYKQRFSVDLNWLLTGEGNMVLPSPEENDGSDGGMEFHLQVKNRDMIALPMFGGVQASAGPGSVHSSEEITSAIAFDPQYLRDLGAKPNQCSVITAQGESMTPTIPDGALLVVDHSQISVEHGCIYVFNVADRLVVKRARWSMDQILTLISDNPSPDYPDEQFNDERAYQLNVVGRVVFHGRRA